MGTPIDMARIHAQQKNYLDNISSDINKKAGVDLLQNRGNNIVEEFLYGMFLYDIENKKVDSVTLDKDIVSLMWTFGGENALQKEMPNLFNKFTRVTINIFLNSWEQTPTI